jgi:hypothetical protein
MSRKKPALTIHSNSEDIRYARIVFCSGTYRSIRTYNDALQLTIYRQEHNISSLTDPAALCVEPEHVSLSPDMHHVNACDYALQAQPNVTIIRARRLEREIHIVGVIRRDWSSSIVPFHVHQ